MATRRLVDTNVVLRFLVEGDEKLKLAAYAFFQDCADGAVEGVILESVLAECVYVLDSFYGNTRQDIAERLSLIITSEGIAMANAKICLAALQRYGTSKLHFVDCLLAATAVADGIDIATLDRELAKAAGIKSRLV
jgi:predicted nucleic-acid-binding protein